MPGIPRGFTDPYPIEIIQQDHQIVILHEYYHQVRRIFMDGREARNTGRIRWAVTPLAAGRARCSSSEPLTCRRTT